MKYTDDGYVDFASFAPVLTKAINKGIVIPNDLCGDLYQGYWVYDNGVSYFLKIPNYYALSKADIQKRLFTEILLEELATIAGLNVIETKVALINKERHELGMISQSYLRDGYDVVSGSDIVLEYLDFLEKKIDPFTKKKMLYLYFKKNNTEDVLENDSLLSYNSLEFIWASLLYHFRNSKNKLGTVELIMQKLTKRYIFQFLMMQQDFHLKNWEIQENYTSSFLSPLYDLDHGFHNLFDTKYNNSMKSYMDNTDTVYLDFSRFYDSSSSEIKEEVHKQLSILTPEALINCINIIESKYNYTFPDDLKNGFINKYLKHYQKLLDICQDNKKSISR